MANALRNGLSTIVGVSLATAAMAQDPFTWTHSSIGGGGFCLEIRFAPPNFFNKPNSQTLYLATDVSGVYRSEAMDASGEVTQWKRLVDPNPTSDEKHHLQLYTSSLAFTDKFQYIPNNHRLIVGTQEGIYIWNEANQTWRAPAVQPDRTSLAGQGLNMDPKDGKYPWIGIVRQCPPNTRYLTAGIGDIRESSANEESRFGLSAVLRSSDGGDNWEAVKIPQGVAVTNTEEVHDIDFIILPNTLGQTLDYTFITTESGIYLMYDSVDVVTEEVFKVNFKRISPASPSDWRNLEVLGDAAGVVQTVDNLLLFASRRDSQQGTDVYRMNTTMASMLGSSFTPNWQPESVAGGSWDSYLSKLEADPRSRIGQFQIFVGKKNAVAFCVRNESDPLWYKIYSNPTVNNIDNGYRADPTHLVFGSFDINPQETLANPNVYAAWSYGPFMTKGNNDSSPTGYRQQRQVEQIFTDLQGTDGTDNVYRSRVDLDEVGSKGCPPVFHQSNPNVIMAGFTDNGILRSVDGGQNWSHRRLRSKDSLQADFNTTLQTVYHIAYHPKNPDLVIASAGPTKTPGLGELVKNTQGGAGDENTWTTIAGGNASAGNLPNGRIVGFAFDVKQDSNGVFVALWSKGLFYGKIDPNGNVTSNFQQITGSTLNAKIPTTVAGRNRFSRIMFDPNDPDVLYVSRAFPSGGVFRIKLVSNRTQFDPANGVVQVDEVIKGRYAGNQLRGYDDNFAVEVNDLLVTPTHVFAGISPETDENQNPKQYFLGGLVRWAKTANPPPADSIVNDWRIGGPNNAGGTVNTTISIGGLARDPNDFSMYAITNQFTFQKEHKYGSDPAKHRLFGESNYKFMNLWRSTDNGATFSKLTNSSMKFANALSMAFFYSNANTLKLLVPTHGNGIWIGSRTVAAPKSMAASPDSIQSGENLPRRFALHQNYPNPFNPTTAIKYDLPKGIYVTLEVYDMLGRKIRTLVEEKLGAGYRVTVWDGKNDQGLPVSSGLYFYRLKTTEFTKVRKATLLR